MLIDAGRSWSVPKFSEKSFQLEAWCVRANASKRLSWGWRAGRCDGGEPTMEETHVEGSANNTKAGEER